MAGRVWLITGTSSGFGRAIADEALSRGDSVVATARRPEALADLAEIHRNYISQIEGGKRNLSFFNVVKIARALKVSPSRLIDPIK